MQQPPNRPNYGGGQQQPQQPNTQQQLNSEARPKPGVWEPQPEAAYDHGYQPVPQQPMMPQQPQYSPPPQYYAAPGYPPQQQYPQQHPMQPYPQQPAPFYQQPYPQQPYPQQPYPQQQVMQAVNVNVNVQQKGPGLIVRAIYFFFIGWWLGFFWLNFGFTLCAMIVTLPLGLAMLNRLPLIMTLRQPSTATNVSVATTSTVMHPGAAPGPMMTMQTVNVNVQVSGTKQINFFVRALYFIFIGFWLGAFWAYLAYSLCLTLVLLPIGVMMFNRLPAVLTLRRN